MSIVKREFASEADFDAWHETAKTAAGLPIVGVNSLTGEPAPGKQQTTEYAALDRGFNDTPLLTATVADSRLVQRGLTDGLIRADLLTAEEMLALIEDYPAWETGVAYAVGDLRAHSGNLYECIQAHTSQADWEPFNVPALWNLAPPHNVIPEWVQPTGAHDAYPLGAQVTHNGSVWESTEDANVWEPGVFGWVTV